MVNGISSPKDKLTWTKVEFEQNNQNIKTINAIHAAFYFAECKRISMCEIANDAWDIIETVHEGTLSFKNNRL